MMLLLNYYMNLFKHEAELEQEGIELGQDYPKPLVDHKEARDHVMSVFKQI